MVKIKIISVGKIKEPWLNEACEGYRKRLSPWASLEFLWVKDDTQLIHFLNKEKFFVLLDPNGTMHDSVQFSSFMMKKLESAGSQLTFVIGGADGLPKELRSQGPLVSLSKMTFTHQISRLVLAEQLYRAFMIEKGRTYHK